MAVGAESNRFTAIGSMRMFFIMAALHSRCGHYILQLWFFLLLIITGSIARSATCRY